MGRERNNTGQIGEDIAIRFLKRKGYVIIGRNIRTPFGELDIITKVKGTVVFVEVKTRASSSLGPPLLAVTRDKQRHIIKNALSYLKRYDGIDADWRIDVVSVKLGANYKLENIELIENAVEDIYWR